MAKKKKAQHGACYCAFQRDAKGIRNAVCGRSKKGVRRLASRLGRKGDKKHGRYTKVVRSAQGNCA